MFFVYNVFLKLFKRFYLFVFREGEGREKELEKHWCVRDTSIGRLSQDPNRNPGMCPHWELNQRPFDSQAGTQLSEPLQARVNVFNIQIKWMQYWVVIDDLWSYLKLMWS